MPIVDLNVGLSDNLSVEGFYQAQWEKTEIDASGTFFSNNDFASPGGRFVFLGFGQADGFNADLSTGIPDDPAAVIATPNAFFSDAGLGAVVPRGTTREADDSGQFGVAVRYFAEALNETEFGAYFINYHSRLPIISGRTGTAASLVGIGVENYAASARYFTEFPEDIRLGGLSFNTVIGRTALQGEVSYRDDQPLQLDDVEILQAAIAPGAVAARCSGAAPLADPVCLGTLALFNANQIIADLGGITLGNLGGFFERDIAGFRRFDVVQAQVTATHIFGPIASLGVDQWVVIGEVGVTHVRDMPSESKLLLEGPNTPLPGTATSTLIAQGFNGLPRQSGGFPDATSMGYQVRARLDFLSAIGPINLFPSLAFSHDVHGTTPLPLGNFIEDRAAITVGLTATYLSSWSASVRYTNFFAIGDDEHNMSNDRDFVSLNIKYSF